MYTTSQLKTILEKSGIVSTKDFENYEKGANEMGKPVEIFLLEEKVIEQEQLYEAASKYFKIPLINLKDTIINKEALLSIPEPMALNHNLIAFDWDEKKIKIALLDPSDLEILEFIKKTTGREPVLHMTTPDSLKDGLKRYQEKIKSEIENFSEDKKNASGLIGAGDADLKNIPGGITVVKIVNDIIEYAIFQDASDIHIEAEEKEVNVRYRIDGILKHVMTLNKNIHPGLMARLKILANLKVDEHRLPQDGRFKLNTDRYKVSFRVSIIPTFDGEKVVIRLLNEKAQILTLDQLGLQSDALETVKRNIEKPHGMILVTGPTGSGKTTTLYTVLNILNTPKVNISTIEDPIEYRMPHVNQSQVSPKIGFTFASGLRAFLRQDPDIIMVGEIRDQETAEIAVHAAMTGHLLLSTLHTNDTVTTLPRLSQMGIPTFLIASTTNIIISQRLVRKICPHCRKEMKLDKKMINEMKKRFDMQSMLEKMVKEKRIKSSEAASPKFYIGEGCKKCNNSGYKGRLGIYEVLEISPEIQNLILKNADVADIKKEAESQGMISMLEDGLIKILKGITSIEEVIRVTKD